MGNLFHQSLLDGEEDPHPFSLTKFNMQQQQLMMPTYQTPSQILPSPDSHQVSKILRMTILNIQQVEASKLRDQSESKMLLSSIVKPRDNKKSFQLASTDAILKYNNKLIKEVQHSLELDPDSICEGYQDKEEPYVIKLSDLPFKAKSMPASWVYIGQWYQGYPHGVGKIYHITFKYEGVINKGIPHFKGRITTLQEVYEGEIEMNRRCGFGRLLTRNGYYFEGNWKGNERVGEGYQIHKNGHVFEGEYKHNNVYKGTLYSPKPEIKKKLNNIENHLYLKLIRAQYSTKYHGFFSNNKFEGKGAYTWAGGRTYDGKWSQGKMHGYGVFTWPSGKRYQGNYENNRKCGFGRYYSEPKIYEGYWQKGKPEGKGKIIKGDEVMYKLWLNGKMIKSDLEAEAFSELSEMEQQRDDESDEFY